MADPICRWRNPYISTIVELVKILPHEVMPSERFREIVEKRWSGFFHTPYQLACQVGLYYESDDGVYYPRFDHDIDENEASSYMKRWIKRYYVPNPYTKSLKTLQNPKPFLASIISYIYEHPDEKELHSILENVFQESIGNIDIISNVLNTYTDLIKVDAIGNVVLTPKAKDFMKQFIDRNDKKAFFDTFSEEVLEITQEEVLRQSSAATFLRKALEIVIAEDTNLNRLAALNKYKETNKQLKINGFNLWRKKDDLPPRLEDVYQNLEIEYNDLKYVMYLEWTPADMESMFFPVFNNAYQGMFGMAKEGNDYVLYRISQSKKKEEGPLQQIFYGAPGTGKSHKIKNNANVKIADEKNLVFRTTFHPDSDYSTFVGAYKPTMKPVADKYKAVAGKDEEITYSFAPQAFLQAYVAAWNNPEDNVYLIIEEINRGNCAQIFGDLFQLLDRKEGVSEYPIMADRDLAKYLLNGKDENNVDVLTNKEGIKDGKLCLPKNLYIWATMNTSDQSLFPIDSAFKRRWDWVYIPIKNHEEKNYKIDIDGAIYKWWGFLDKINYVIGQITSSEDKKLGYFFVKANDKIVDANKFVGKVLFYLWNDVFKNYGFENAIFNRGDNKIFNFSDFFDKNGEPDTAVVNEFLKRLDETVDKEHSFVLIENEGSPSSLIIMHNGESIEGDSAVSKYIEFINRAIKEKDVNEVADCLGADMTQTPPEDTTRKFLQVADSGWYLATNIGIGVMKSNINKIKKLGVDVVIE